MQRPRRPSRAPPCRWSAPTIAPVTTGAAGGYTVTDVWEGTYTFRVEAPGYGVVETDLAVGPGSTIHDFSLTVVVTLLGDGFRNRRRRSDFVTGLGLGQRHHRRRPLTD